MFLLMLTSLVTIATAEFYNAENCGTRPAVPAERPETRIFNGRDAPPGSWPWIGRMAPRPQYWECMVVLIHEQYALTMVDCALLENVTIVFGDNEIDGTSPNRYEVTFNRVFAHSDYSFLERDNVAIVKLDSALTFTDFVRPVCLSDVQNESEVYDNCWTAGWGQINAKPEYTPYLQEAPSQPLSEVVCSSLLNYFAGFFHESFLCTLTGPNGESHPCSDDLGAPVMCDRDGRWYLIGQYQAYVGSCGNSFPFYTRTSSVVDFIRDIITRLEACSEPDVMCSDGITCVLEHELCDGRDSCPDGGDELDCPGISCANITCLNGGTCVDTAEGFECVCADDMSGLQCEIVDCGPSTIELLPGASLNLTSPLYPQNYPDDKTCAYAITAPDGYKVLVEFVDFFTELGWDFLYIGDSKISGDIPPANYTSIDETLTIRFISDTAFTLRGYSLRLSAFDATGVNECEWDPCVFDGRCIDEEDGYSYECIDERLGWNCITPDDHCGPQDIFIEDGASANLTSFYYNIGNVYGIQFGCKHVVSVPDGHQVRVEFVDVDLVLPWDTLLLDRNVYNSSVGEYISDGNTLEIVYYTLTQAKGVNLILHDFIRPDGNECEREPCANGAVCVDEVNGFSCKCRRGFYGPTCMRGLSRCRRNQFMCSNWRCIKASAVCDGRNHCGDASDEFKCDCEFPCYNGRCIPQRYVCDNKNQCGDWSDELNC